MNITNQLAKAIQHCQLSQFDRAIPILKNILRKKPDQVEAITNLGVIFAHQKNYKEAERLFDQAQVFGATDRNFLFNLINIKIEMHKIDEASQILKKLDRNKDAQFYIVKLKLMRIENKKRIAMDVINDILHSEGRSHYELRFNIAYTYNYFKLYDNAICLYKELYKENNHNESILYNLGVSLNNNHQYSEAIEYFRKAEDYVGFSSNIKKNIAISLVHQGMYSDALNELKQCIAIDKTDYDCLMKIAYILELDGKTDQAIDIYDEVISLEPKFYTASQDKSYIKLKMGDFHQGWDLYRYRQYQDLKKCKINDFEILKIDWQKKINIYEEQGVGDWVFHLRFLSLVEKNLHNASVIIDKRFHPLLTDNFSGIKVNTASEINKDEQNINLATIGRFLIHSKNDIHNIKKWKLNQPLESSILNNTFSKTKKNIGISWMSENKNWGDDKSINLDWLKPLLIKQAEYNFINLQYGEIKEQIDQYVTSNNVDIKNEHGIDLYNNIYGLAQLINECDVIVTISNLNAHIAGALGKKTILMLPKSNGKMWYWTEENGISNWYPSVTIIRQDKNETWKDSIEKVIHLIKTVE
jgi:tetratricopeptide (TPR) repeat protein